MIGHPPRSPLFPSPPLSRLDRGGSADAVEQRLVPATAAGPVVLGYEEIGLAELPAAPEEDVGMLIEVVTRAHGPRLQDRKSTRLNSSHSQISYAGFCLTTIALAALCLACASAQAQDAAKTAAAKAGASQYDPSRYPAWSGPMRWTTTRCGNRYDQYNPA